VRFDTKLLHGGQTADPSTGAVNPPIYLSSTYKQSAPGQDRGYVYSRSGNPTRAALESALAAAEGGRVGLAFSSGMGAITTLLLTLPSGSRVVATDDLYGGTWRILEYFRRTYQFDVEYVDSRDPTYVAEAIGAKPTALLWLETPTNPLMHLVDLKAVGRAARDAGVPVGVDNTFASPALQRPIEWGVEYVVHSTTKYLGGHSDIVGGAIVTRSKRTGEKLRWLQNAAGAVPSPFDSFLVLRGLHTLGVRMRAHEASARAVAKVLEKSSAVKSVYYPGLKSHPQYELARRQMDGFGGMLSFEIRGGMPAARRFLRRLKVFTLAESLGGVESLVDHPASMTHASVAPAVRRAHGVTDGILRLSCGLESPKDLAEDVRRALGR
jgi:cystathionine gamma-lyase